MAWPTDDLTTTHLDSATDDPSQARVELKSAIDKLKAVLAEVDAGQTVFHSGNDGPGSGLDADSVDGFSAAQLRNSGYQNEGTLSNDRLSNIPQSKISSLVTDLSSKLTLTTSANASSTLGSKHSFKMGNLLICVGSVQTVKGSNVSETFALPFTAVLGVYTGPATTKNDYTFWLESITNNGFDIHQPSHDGGAPLVYYSAIGFKTP